MYLLVSKFRFLEFRLLLSRVAPYLQFVTTNCLKSLAEKFYSIKMLLQAMIQLAPAEELTWNFRSSQVLIMSQ